MIVDTLKVTVGFVVNLLAKVLVSFRPHLRKIGLKKKRKKRRGYRGHFNCFSSAFVLVASV